MTVSWQSIVQEKRAQRDKVLEPYLAAPDKLPDDKVLKVLDILDSDENGLLTEQEKYITNISDINELLSEIAAGKLSATSVTEAYIKRATLAHQLTNCLTEPVFEQALKDAQDLDDHYSKTNGKLVGPLHGIPITLKDQFNVQGVDTTLGYVGRSFSPATKENEAALVKMLRDMGAIIIAKTNLPQSIMWCETENPLWGLTTNPQRRDFTPGGSTGGEGALLALKGSIIGWGTDIGGSVRIPQSMAGGYGLRPTSGRLPYRDVPVSTEGQEHVPSVIGPMTRDLATLTSITRTVIDKKPWTYDAKCIPIPWRQGDYEGILNSDQEKKPIFGVIYDDGFVKPHPPIERALKETVAALEKAGYEVVVWSPKLHRAVITVLDTFYKADGGEDIRRDVEKAGEPFIPHVARLIDCGPGMSVYEYWQVNQDKIRLQNAYLDQWNASSALTSTGKPVDFILLPAMPHTAVPHTKAVYVGYTKVWNVLDYPAAVFPVSKVDKTLDEPLEDYTPRNPIDEKIWTTYDKESMHGLPINLQLVGRRFEEEKVLAGVSVIQKTLNNKA